MEKETKKPWERPWTTDEIRAQSANWNLAGDAGLLNHLQEFSQNLLSRTHATEVALDKLMEDMKTTSINVQNVTNTFLSLANTQFVENRVYDDDEKETPVEEKVEDMKKTKSKEEKESEAFENVNQVLQMGMSFLDKYFETVEVPASDSEDEETPVNMSRLILKPRNPYSSRPLPYFIGSQEFMEDDNVGLGDVLSDTEGSPDQNVVHSSESDEDIPPDDSIPKPSKQRMSSSSDLENSEPESDRSESMVKQKRPKLNSTSLGRDEEERDMFGQESPPEADVGTLSGGLCNSFSNELASKLGVSKPLIPPQDDDNLFGRSSGTEDDEGLFGKSSRPTYSEKKGLFDDINSWQNTADSLWDDNHTKPKDLPDSDSRKPLRKDVLFGPDDVEDENNDIFAPYNPVDNKQTETSPRQVTASSTPKEETSEHKRKDTMKHSVTEDLLNKRIKDTASSLFGKDDVEDDLFAANPAVSSSDSRQSTDFGSMKKKKLPGAVRVIDDVNLFGNISPVIQPGSSSVADRSSLPETSVSQQEAGSGIGRTVARKEAENESLGHVANATEKSLTFDSSLFQATSTKVDNNEASSKSLFKEEHQSDSLFDKPRNQDNLLRPNMAGNVSGPKLFPGLKSKARKSVSLFEDSDSGEDELLFSSTSSTSSRSRRSQGSGDLLAGGGGDRTLFRKGLFEEGFLETENKEEPEVDIFKPFSESKSFQSEAMKNKTVEDQKDDLQVTSKIGSSIFDDIDDDEDDIFAVPKSKAESFVYKNNFLHEKSLLFTDVSSQQPLSSLGVLSSGKGLSEEEAEEPSGRQTPSSNTTQVLEKDNTVSPIKVVESDTLVKSPTSSSADQLLKEPCDVIAENSEVNASSVEENEQNHPVLNVKAEPPRSLNIRKTTDIITKSLSNDGEDDDLFENSAAHKSALERVPSDNITARSNSFGKLLEGFRSTSQNSSPEEKNRRTPSDLSNSPSETNVTAEVPSSRSPSTSPIKKPLCIDPRALLPGAKPPTATVHSDVGVGFDKPAVVSSVLHSAGKERVKIQAKRRPPTRKARQEALKATNDGDINGLDAPLSPSHVAPKNVELPSANTVSTLENRRGGSPQGTGNGEESGEGGVEKSEPEDLLSPLTDEEDLFAVPQELPGDEGSCKEGSSPKNLFGGAPVLSPFKELLDTEKDSEDATVSPFLNPVGQADDFLSGELGSSTESPSTFESQPTSNIKNKTMDILENASLFDASAKNKMFAADLQSEDRLFDNATPESKSFNKVDEDDDSLFSSSVTKITSKESESAKTKMKAEAGGLFSSLDSPTKSLFSSVSDPTKSSGPSKPSASVSGDEKYFSDPIHNLPLTNDTISDSFLKGGGSVSQRQDSDDLFGESSGSSSVNVRIMGDASSSASLEKSKPHISSLFGDDSADTDDLFSSSSITAGKKRVVASSNVSSMLPDSKVKGATDSLFDDCDDDIFAVGLSKPRGNESSLFPEVVKSDRKETDPKKNPLTKQQNPRQTVTVHKMTPKDDSFEDPLMVTKK